MTLDPLLDEFHRRMPDVRVVVLPPTGEPPAPEPVEPAEAERRAAAATAEAAELLRSAWPAASAGAPAPPELTIEWDAGDAPGTALALAQGRTAGPTGDVRAPLTQVRAALEDAGWSVVARPVGDAGARLVASGGGREIHVVAWGPGEPWTVAAAVPAELGDRSTAQRAEGATTLAWQTPPEEPA